MRLIFLTIAVLLNSIVYSQENTTHTDLRSNINLLAVKTLIKKFRDDQLIDRVILENQQFDINSIQIEYDSIQIINVNQLEFKVNNSYQENDLYLKILNSDSNVHIVDTVMILALGQDRETYELIYEYDQKRSSYNLIDLWPKPITSVTILSSSNSVKAISSSAFLIAGSRIAFRIKNVSDREIFYYSIFNHYDTSSDVLFHPLASNQQVDYVQEILVDQKEAINSFKYFVNYDNMDLKMRKRDRGIREFFWRLKFGSPHHDYSIKRSEFNKLKLNGSLIEVTTTIENLDEIIAKMTRKKSH